MLRPLILLLWVQLSAAESYQHKCRHVDPIMVPIRSPAMCCADPLVAAIAYVVGSAPTRGPCVMYNANHRFDRFREWITLLGGYVSEKITFYRGHFVDQNGNSRIGFGGIFLNPNEHLYQGELLFVVPDEATFNDRMILRAYPWLSKFEYGNSFRFWLSMGLAALLRHNPHFVAPWQALLPDLSDHPLIRPNAISDLRGTQAGTLIYTTLSYINSGCRNFDTYMAFLEISCKDIHEAHAIIASRAFGLEKISGAREMSSGIPFGLDLLNHSPHTISWTSQVRYGSASRPKKIETVFYLLGFTLSDSRELFNNYGGHALAHVLAMYGYTAPDTWDELVVHATPYAMLDGVRYEAIYGTDKCKSSISIQDLVGSEICKKDIDNRRLPFDKSGSFRLTNKDVISFSPIKDFICRTQVDSLVWLHILKKLSDRLLRINYNQFVLALNGMDGSEPILVYNDAVVTALCAASFGDTKSIMDFVESATTCDPDRDHYYLEEYPKSRLVKQLSREALYDLCSWYEFDLLGTLQDNLYKWIAYRNARIVQTNTVSRLVESWIPKDFTTHEDFTNFLAHIVDNKLTVFFDKNGTIDKTYRKAVERLSNSRIEQLEEVYRYKMQAAYMVMRKCRQPLELLVSDH